MEFLTILKESFKLLPKNGKLMAPIALLSILLASTFFVSSFYSLETLIENVRYTINDSSLMPDPIYKALSPQMTITLFRQDSAFILGDFIAWFLVISTIEFFLSIWMITVSSSSYKDQSSPLKGLISGIRSTWIGVCITCLYVSALAFGCSFALVTLVSPLLVYPSRVTLFVYICVAIAAFLFYLHLVVSWMLAVIVSVLEESCYGFEALARGAQLVRGKRFHGFLLNIGFAAVVFVVFQGCKTLLVDKKCGYNPTLYGWILVTSFLLAKMFHVVAYTVLYFHCKKHHGEEELKGEFEYTKLPNTQLVKDIP